MVMLDVPIVDVLGETSKSRYSPAPPITMPTAGKGRRRGRTAPKPLSPEDFETAEAFSELMLQKLMRVGVKVTIESDFEEFVRLRLAASPETPMNTTYDPARVDLSLINAFWFRVTNSAGQLVAMIAHRAFDSVDLMQDIALVRLWHNRPAPAENCVFRAIDLEAARGISGRIAHSGGLWIRPDHRKLNLSGYLDHLGRALMMRNFWFDHMTAFIVDKLAATGIGIRQYGFPGISGWIEFNFFTFRPVRLAYCQMTRAESASRMRRWLEQPNAATISELYA
jgi:hypothetical protein